MNLALERRYCIFYCTVCAARYYTYKMSCGHPLLYYVRSALFKNSTYAVNSWPLNAVSPHLLLYCAVSLIQKQYAVNSWPLNSVSPHPLLYCAVSLVQKQYAVNSWSCVRFAYVQYAYKYLNSVDRCKRASFLWKL